MSDKDIGAGKRWSTAISQELDRTDFGIVCVTLDNLSAPWIHFEAGALAKRIHNSLLVPFLIDRDPTEVGQSPLSQFQMVQDDKRGTWSLVQMINGALSPSLRLSDERLKRAFDNSWPLLDIELRKLPPSSSGKPKRSSDDKVDEILTLIRDLVYRVNGDGKSIRRSVPGETDLVSCECGWVPKEENFRLARESIQHHVQSGECPLGSELGGG